MTDCLDLLRPREPSGTSLVIVDPAPITEFLPMLIGATNSQLDPTKDPSPILVGYLLVPS